MVELRVLDAKTGPHFTETVSGYYDREHYPQFCRDALADWGPQAKVYMTLQRVKTACLNRAVNHAAPVKKRKTTSNSDVERLDKFFIDVDPVRPVSDVPATDAEKAEAKAVLKAALSDLRGRGWPEPVVTDSGNGFAAEYLTDLPPEDAGLLTRALKALAVRHDTPGAKVDVTIGDPCQLRPGHHEPQGRADP